MVRQIVVVLAGMMIVAGCASAPEQATVDNAPIGAYPANYETLVKSNFSETLFDPYSAVFNFKIMPRRGYAGNRIAGAQIGWITCGTVNAKNRFGAYVGARPFLAVISNGAVVHRELDSFNAQQCLGGNW